MGDVTTLTLAAAEVGVPYDTLLGWAAVGLGGDRLRVERLGRVLLVSRQRLRNYMSKHSRPRPYRRRNREVTTAV
jgi:hypothetical protein